MRISAYSVIATAYTVIAAAAGSITILLYRMLQLL